MYTATCSGLVGEFDGGLIRKRNKSTTSYAMMHKETCTLEECTCGPQRINALVNEHLVSMIVTEGELTIVAFFL